MVEPQPSKVTALRKYADYLRRSAASFSVIADAFTWKSQSRATSVPYLWGDVGAVNTPFTFSTRDLQQQIKGQYWVMDGGIKVIEAALMNLEKWCWVEIDGDRWMPRSVLLNHRW